MKYLYIKLINPHFKMLAQMKDFFGKFDLMDLFTLDLYDIIYFNEGIIDFNYINL